MRVPCLSLLVLLAGCGAPGARSEPAPTAVSSPAEGAAMSETSPVAERLAAADALFRGRKYAEALDAYRAVAEQAGEARDRSVEAEALAQVARMYSATKRLEEGRPWLARAREVADPAHPLGWTRYLGVRGIFEREGGDRARALATFTEMHDYARARDLPRRAIDAAHHAAIVASPEQQVAWAERGIAAAEAAGDEGWLAVLWNNLGATHEDRGEWTAAADAYEQARTYHYRTGGEHQRLVADWALGRASLRAGRLERAEALLPDCLERARARHAAAPNAETGEWVGWTLAAHGELLVARGQRAEGLTALEEGRARLVEAGIEKWWPGALADLDARIAAAR